MSLSDVELIIPLGGTYACDRVVNLLKPSLELFWPEAKLTMLFDDTDRGRELAERCGGSSKAVFIPPEGLGEWADGMNARLVAHKFSSARFLGHVDDDTLFTTRVTPANLFDWLGRPRVLGRLGKHQNRFWADAALGTERILGMPQVARFMTYFPVVVATEHQRQFWDLLSESRFGGVNRTEVAWGEFNILGTYLYRHHRESYSWSFLRPGASRRAEPIWVSVAQHAGWMPHEHGSYSVPLGRMAEGYCRSSASPSPACRAFRARDLHMDLFRFVDVEWSAHPNATAAQLDHYRRIRALGLTVQTRDEDWLEKAVMGLRRARLTFPGRTFSAVIRGELELVLPTVPFPATPSVRVVDLMHCFVGPARVYEAVLAAIGDVSDLVLDAVQGTFPWRVKASSVCRSVDPGQSSVLWCHVEGLAFDTGDCLGWRHGGRGGVASLGGPEAGRTLVKWGDSDFFEDERMHAIEVRWREPL